MKKYAMFLLVGLLAIGTTAAYTTDQRYDANSSDIFTNNIDKVDSDSDGTVEHLRFTEPMNATNPSYVSFQTNRTDIEALQPLLKTDDGFSEQYGNNNVAWNVKVYGTDSAVPDDYNPNGSEAFYKEYQYGYTGVNPIVNVSEWETQASGELGIRVEMPYEGPEDNTAGINLVVDEIRELTGSPEKNTEYNRLVEDGDVTESELLSSDTVFGIQWDYEVPFSQKTEINQVLKISNGENGLSETVNLSTYYGQSFLTYGGEYTGEWNFGFRESLVDKINWNNDLTTKTTAFTDETPDGSFDGLTVLDQYSTTYDLVKPETQKPTINSVESNLENGQTTFIVDAQDNTNVSEVEVVFDGQTYGLSENNGTYTGTFDIGSSGDEYSIRVVDQYDNIQTSQEYIGIKSYVVGQSVTGTVEVSEEVEQDYYHEDGDVSYVHATNAIVKVSDTGYEIIEQGSWTDVGSHTSQDPVVKQTTYSHDFSRGFSESGQYGYMTVLVKSENVAEPQGTDGDFDGSFNWGSYNHTEVDRQVTEFYVAEASAPQGPIESLGGFFDSILGGIVESITGIFDNGELELPQLENPPQVSS